MTVLTMQFWLLIKDNFCDLNSLKYLDRLYAEYTWGIISLGRS